MNYKLILGIVLAGMAVLFIIQNVPAVELRFLLWTLPMPRALLMFLFLLTGIVLGWLLHSRAGRRKALSLQNETL
jgi:uncharacterized integral membrane protein